MVRRIGTHVAWKFRHLTHRKCEEKTFWNVNLIIDWMLTEAAKTARSRTGDHTCARKYVSSPHLAGFPRPTLIPLQARANRFTTHPSSTSSYVHAWRPSMLSVVLQRFLRMHDQRKQDSQCLSWLLLAVYHLLILGKWYIQIAVHILCFLIANWEVYISLLVYHSSTTQLFQELLNDHQDLVPFVCSTNSLRRRTTPRTTILPKSLSWLTLKASRIKLLIFLPLFGHPMSHE